MNNSQYYIRVSTACPVTNVADIDFNIENIKKMYRYIHRKKNQN